MPRLAQAALCAATLLITAQASAAPKLTFPYIFQGLADGGTPNGPLIALNGDLYGTTVTDGHLGDGTVFRFDPGTGREHPIYNFQGGNDGSFPASGLAIEKGIFYGTTSFGGGFGCFGLGCGTIFAVNPANGRETQLFSFGNGADGGNPNSGVVVHAGKLYTTTTDFGSGCGGCGNILQLDLASGALSVLYIFTAGADGSAPLGTLIYTKGLLYGTTSDFNRANGTVFAFNPATLQLTTLYSFKGGTDGMQPEATLLLHNTMLYGTTLLGGAANLGTVFTVDPATGTETILHAFSGGTDGASPSGGLILHDGKLYGVTTAGGANGGGTAYTVDPVTGAEKILISFPPAGAGASPFGGLLYTASAFWGVTCCNDAGAIFDITP
jgi:uncharacterized repeat protein (TIGR03803 family)